MASQPVRQPAVAGLFYPADPLALTSQVQMMLAQAEPMATTCAPKALIVPHAGYMYSGSTAAAAFAQLEPWREQIRRVVLIGPSHRFAFQGVALPSAVAFASPLGTLEVDSEAVFALAAHPEVLIEDRAHAQEHALEVLLPFLQLALDHCRIVPLVVGQISPEALAPLIETLWGGPETLIVVSSDLSHYLPYADAQQTDTQTTEDILALHAQLASNQACGATGINALLSCARQHRCQARLLALRNSGDTAGDRTRVVGYTAIRFDPPTHSTH